MKTIIRTLAATVILTVAASAHADSPYGYRGAMQPGYDAQQYSGYRLHPLAGLETDFGEVTGHTGPDLDRFHGVEPGAEVLMLDEFPLFRQGERDRRRRHGLRHRIGLMTAGAKGEECGQRGQWGGGMGGASHGEVEARLRRRRETRFVPEPSVGAGATVGSSS